MPEAPKVARRLVGTLGIFLPGTVIARRYGRTVKWWDETFWATAAIAGVSIVLTVVGTLWISWLILNRQLAHERETQDKLREQQLADLRVEVQRDRRVRQAEGLAEGLGRVMHVMNSYCRFRWSSMPGTTAHHVTKQIYEMDDVVARMGKTPLADVVSGFLYVVRGWALAFNHVGELNIPNDMRDLWKAVGYELIKEVDTLHGGISNWEDSGKLPDLELSAVQSKLEQLAVFTAAHARQESR